jgi:large subunit ribosomal protein L22
MQIKAKAQYLRVSPRKVRLVIDVIRGLDVTEALTQLNFMGKAAVAPIKKLLESALANATNNHKLDKNNLYIATVIANEGPVLKRWLPRAFGRATTIRKKSTHLTIVLAEKVPTEKNKVIKKEDKAVGKKMEVVTEKPKDTVKSADEGEESKKGEVKKGGKGFTKKLFSRKAG